MPFTIHDTVITEELLIDLLAHPEGGPLVLALLDHDPRRWLMVTGAEETEEYDLPGVRTEEIDLATVRHAERGRQRNLLAMPVGGYLIAADGTLFVRIV